jgi:hypothetical protein
VPPFLTNDGSPRRSHRATDPRSTRRTTPLLDARCFPRLCDGEGRPLPAPVRGVSASSTVVSTGLSCSHGLKVTAASSNAKYQ